MADLIKNMANMYNAGNSYSQGDVVIYDDMMYMANDNTSGTFDPSKWDNLYLVDLIKGIGETYDFSTYKYEISSGSISGGSVSSANCIASQNGLVIASIISWAQSRSDKIELIINGTVSETIYVTGYNIGTFIKQVNAGDVISLKGYDTSTTMRWSIAYP